MVCLNMQLTMLQFEMKQRVLQKTSEELHYNEMISTKHIGFKLMIKKKITILSIKSLLILYTLKPVLSGHSKRRPKIGFQDLLSLNAGQRYCRMLQESILQYF